MVRPGPRLSGVNTRRAPRGRRGGRGRSVDAEDIPDGEIVAGAFNHPDLIARPHIALDEDAQQQIKRAKNRLRYRERLGSK